MAKSLSVPVFVSNAVILLSQKTHRQVETSCLSTLLGEIATSLSFDNFTKLSISKPCKIFRSFYKAI